MVEFLLESKNFLEIFLDIWGGVLEFISRHKVGMCRKLRSTPIRWARTDCEGMGTPGHRWARALHADATHARTHTFSSEFHSACRRVKPPQNSWLVWLQYC